MLGLLVCNLLLEFLRHLHCHIHPNDPYYRKWKEQSASDGLHPVLIASCDKPWHHLRLHTILLPIIFLWLYTSRLIQHNTWSRLSLLVGTISTQHQSAILRAILNPAIILISDLLRNIPPHPVTTHSPNTSPKYIYLLFFVCDSIAWPDLYSSSPHFNRGSLSRT